MIFIVLMRWQYLSLSITLTLKFNKRIVIHSDNQAAVQIINKGTTGDDNIMRELRTLFWLSATYNFHLTAVYIPGEQNTLADAISRLHNSRHLLNFYSILANSFPQNTVDADPLKLHMSTHSLHFISSRCKSWFKFCYN